MTPKQFRRLLEHIKEEEGLTQTQISKNLGCHKSYLSDIKHGRVNLSDSFLEKMIELYPYISELVHIKTELSLKSSDCILPPKNSEDSNEITESDSSISKLIDEMAAQRKSYENIINKLLEKLDSK